MKHGYECFYSHGGRCAGAVAAVVELLADEYGYPYNQLNARACSRTARADTARATLCGSLGGACAISACSARRTRRVSCATSSTPGTRDHAFPSYQPENGIHHDGFRRDRVRSVRRQLHESDRLRDGRSGRKGLRGRHGRPRRSAVELLNIHFGFEEARRRS